METQDRKKKKPSKKEAQELMIKTFEEEVRKHHVKGLIQGQEVFAQMVLDNINNGKTLDDIKHLCEVTLHKEIAETMEKVINNKGE